MSVTLHDGGGGMDAGWKGALQGQLAAAVAMLRNAIEACPPGLWLDEAEAPAYWYRAFHTLFFLDLYAGGRLQGFAPPAPFGLEELDPSGVLPPRAYTQAELLAYLEHGAARYQAAIAALTEADFQRRAEFDWVDLSIVELHLTTLRHVQHHVAQLNLILRRRTGDAPRGVQRVRTDPA